MESGYSLLASYTLAIELLRLLSRNDRRLDILCSVNSRLMDSNLIPVESLSPVGMVQIPSDAHQTEEEREMKVVVEHVAVGDED